MRWVIQYHEYMCSPWIVVGSMENHDLSVMRNRCRIPFNQHMSLEKIRRKEFEEEN